MIFDVYTPFPGALLIASMHCIADMVYPLHLYPYALVMTQMPPNITTTVFTLLCVWRACDDVGYKAAAAMFASGVLMYLLWGEAMAFGLASIYYCCIHTPLYYLRRAKARSYISLTLAATLTGVCTVASYTLPMDGELVFGHMAQRLFAAHLLVERSKTRWLKPSW